MVSQLRKESAPISMEEELNILQNSGTMHIGASHVEDKV